jgi:hypothetical protein
MISAHCRILEVPTPTAKAVTIHHDQISDPAPPYLSSASKDPRLQLARSGCEVMTYGIHHPHLLGELASLYEISLLSTNSPLSPLTSQVDPGGHHDQSPLV